jgi:hypothetical protein
MVVRDVLRTVQDAEQELATTKGSSVWVVATVARRVHRPPGWAAHPAGVRCGVETVAFLRLPPTRMARRLLER